MTESKIILNEVDEFNYRAKSKTTQVIDISSQEAKELALACWNAGNRHGPDGDRQAEILRICQEGLDKAYKLGLIEGHAK